MSVPRSITAFWLLAQVACAQPAPGPNRADEPLIEKFSYARAVAFADRIAPAWSTPRDCVTCHTNGLHMLSRAWVGGADLTSLDRTRKFTRSYLKRFVEEGETPKGRKGKVEGLVAAAGFLAISEMKTDARLSKTAEKALTHAFSIQHEDGHWPGWLKCGWPPFEVDDHFGTALIAIATSQAPRKFRQRPPISKGMARLRSYLRAHAPANPHQRGMMLWAARSASDLVSRKQRSRWIGEFRKLQRADGGWSMAEMGGGLWKRADGSKLEDASDAYATAFSVFY